MKKQIILTILINSFIIVGNAQVLKDNNSLCQTIYSLAISGNNIFAGTYDGGVFLSSDKGASWVAKNIGLKNYSISSLAISGSNVFAGTANGVYISTNNGDSWTSAYSGLPANSYVKSLAVSGINIFAGTYSGVYLSNDNGSSWTAVNNGLAHTKIYSLLVSGTNIFAGTFGGGVYLSTNNGISWTAKNTGLSGWGNYINALTISENNIFVGTTSGVYVSSNNGDSWTAVNTGLTNTYIYSLAVSEGVVFAGTNNGGLYSSSNNGTSWIAINSGLLTNISVYALSINEGNYFAGTIGKGVYLSMNDGRNWAPANNGLQITISMANSINEMANWDSYPTYEVYDSMMMNFQIDYPNLFKRYELVTLSSGRKLIIGKITSNVSTKVARPQFMYSSTMHGKEPAGFVTMLRFINYLLTNYGIDARITNLVDKVELWILPLSNPDGTYKGGNSTVAGAQRFNINNVDLNRNYPSPVNGPHPDGAIYQPETQTMMNFADTMNFVLAANFHSGHENFYFPWDSWTSSRKHADDDWWRLVGKEFADTCQKYGPLNAMPDYFTEHPSGIIEGGDEGILYGTRADYMTYFKQCREATIEVSYTYIVGSDQLPNYWNSLYRSILQYPEECLYGINGIVTDSCTGKPIRAKVFVNNHDIDNSWVYSGSIFGNYYRPIKEGIWNITYSAPDYKSKTISINSFDKNQVVRNVKLIQVNPDSSFTYTKNANTVSFTSSSTNASTYLWIFGDGSTSTEKNPIHTYSSHGSYNVQLTVTNGCGISTSSQQIINLSVGVVDQSLANSIEISPNPTSSIFSIKINSGISENACISIVDIIGNTIYEGNENLIAGSNQFNIDISDSRQGIYIVRISIPSGNFFYKILKKE